MDFNAEGKDTPEVSGTPKESSEREGDWVDCEENMEKNTMRLAKMLSSLQGMVEIRG